MILPADRRRALTEKARSYAGQVEQVLPYLMSRGVTREAAAMFSLGYVPSGEFAGRLSIPYVTPGGVVQIKYRCADLSHQQGFKHVNDDCPKYLYEAGAATCLYNAQVLIHAAESVALTEGELDAICIQAYTGIPAVGYPGVETWGKQKHWRLCFEGVQEVIVVADGDKPGKDAARRVADSIGLSARVVTLPNGEDANSLIATQGVGALLERLGR